jgi:hypothetical protein
MKGMGPLSKELCRQLERAVEGARDDAEARARTMRTTCSAWCT